MSGYPLSSIQQLIWSIYRLAPENTAYHVPFCFRLPSGTSARHLATAVETVIAAQPICRTRIYKSADGVRQRISEEPLPGLQQLDLTQLDAPALQARLQALAKLPIQLAGGPLVHTYLIKSQDGLLFFALLHHIIVDGLSAKAWLEQINQCYQQLHTGEQPQEILTGASYEDFVRWEQDYLSSPEADAAYQYWAAQLQDRETELPLGESKNAKAFEGATELADLPRSTLDALSQWSIAQGGSLYNTTLSIFGYLLHRLSGAYKLSISTPMGSRPEERFEQSLGVFMNMVPVPVTIEMQQSLSTYLEQQQEQIFDLFEHAHYPQHVLTRKLKKSQPNVAFFFQDFAAHEQSEANALFTDLLPEIRQSGEFELALDVTPHQHGCLIALKYNPGIWSSEKAKQFLADYTRLLSTVTSLGEQPLEALLPSQPKAEGETRGFLEQYEVQVATYPDRLALTDGNRHLSYQQLDEAASQLASYLKSQWALQAEEIIGVYMGRSADTLIAIMAIMKSGVTFLPLDTSFPQERLDYIIADAGIRYCLTDEASAAQFSSDKVAIITASQATADPVLISNAQLPGTDQRAYVIYTSGSTGKPKGVEITHGNLGHFLQGVQTRIQMSPAHQLLALTTISFDIAYLELLLPLTAGASVHLLAQETLNQPKALVQQLNDSVITHVQATPSFWQMALNAGWQGNSQLTLLSGGEAISTTLAAALLTRVNSLWNMYGPTETTIWSSMGLINDAGHIRLGQAIGDTELFVLNEDGELVASGGEGELFIGGSGVARGYLNRPELTAERFVRLSPKGTPIRLYQTGDRVQVQPDGSLRYLGRADGQIKLRGHRIELAEIEHALSRHDHVREAVVVARSTPLGQQLLAFALGYYTQRLNKAQLLSYLASWLPEYMIPVTVHQLQAFPLTPNQKIDRKTLSEADLASLLADFGTNEAKATEPPASETTSDLEGGLYELVAEISGLSVAELDPEATLGELGFDSVSFVTLSDRIEIGYGYEFNPGLFYQYNTLTKLLQHLQDAIPAATVTKEESNPQAAPKVNDTAAAESASTDIAIIGMAGRFPDAPDLRQFWQNLLQGHDAISEMPQERWQWQGDGRKADTDQASPWGGFISHADRFDARFFGISPREAALMDPQQKVLMEVVWQAVEDAGYPMSGLSGQRVGLFAGTSGIDFFELLLQSTQEIDPYTLTGIARSIIPNRISYLFNLHGPSEPVDTACSSSLVAVHRAVQSLLHGESELCLAGGINLMLSPSTFVASDRMGMMSADARCKVFDKEANGYVRGEGCGVVVLKRYEDALRDGDHIYACIKGSGVNHGGKANSLTAPNVEAQGALITDTLQKARVSPEQLNYIETHGTGTALGDPIEVEGLKLAFRNLGVAEGIASPWCRLGSVKANIGHLEAAAGIAGLIKAVLSLQHGHIPPQINFTELNPNIKIKQSPFAINTAEAAWPATQDEPRHTAVSSFGFGGVNAHVVLREAAAVPVKHATEQPLLFVLTAKNEERLQAYAKSWLATLTEGHVDSQAYTSLYHTCYTLQAGREAMACRAAACLHNWDELKAILTALATGQAHEQLIQATSVGKARSKRVPQLDWTTLPERLSAKALEEVAARWVAHAYRIDWTAMYAHWYGEQPKPRRQSLPTYPFERARHWFTITETDEERTAPAQTYLTATAAQEGQVAWTYSVSPEAHYLADHIVAGNPILPGVMYAELMRAASTAWKPAEQLVITELRLLQPLQARPQAIDLQLIITVASGQIEIYCQGAEGAQLHASAVLQSSSTHSTSSTLPALAEDKVLDKATCYDTFRQFGFHYGPSLQVIEELRLANREAVARLHVDKQFAQADFGAAHASAWWPATLDGALQSVVMLLFAGGHIKDQYLPFQIGEISSFAPLEEECTVHIALHEQNPSGIIKSDITLYNQQGDCLLAIRGYALRKIPGRKQKPAEPMLQSTSATQLYASAWESQVLVAQTERSVDTVLYIGQADSEAALQSMIPELQPLATTLAGALPDLTTILDQGVAEPIALIIDQRKPVPQSLVGLWHDLYALGQCLVAKPVVVTLHIYYLYAQEGQPGDAASHEAVAAYFKSIAQETEGIAAKIIGLPQESVLAAESIAAELYTPCTGVQNYRYTVQGRTRKHFVPLSEERPASPACGLRAQGVYLITGGVSGLGLHIAHWLAQSAQATAIILGRRAGGANLQDQLQQLSGNGRIIYHQADVTQARFQQQLEQWEQSYGVIHGVFHTAGISADGLLGNKAQADFEAVMAPKVLGAEQLLRYFAQRPLDFLAFFSSTTAVFGNRGQSDYAWANASLDALAAHYQASDTLITSVNWGPWESGSMLPAPQMLQYMRQQFGIEPIPTATGLQAIATILQHGLRQCLVMQGDASLQQVLLQHQYPQERATPELVPA